MPTATKTRTKTIPIAAEAATPLPPSLLGLLSREQVCAALGGIAQRTLSELVSRGEFPGPDSEVGRSPRWSVALVNAWCEASRHREPARRKPVPPQRRTGKGA